MKLSVIIPMYNEGKIIEATARELSAYMESVFDEYEILFCDDGSRDGCGELVSALGLPNVSVVGYGQNRGKGCAVRHGMLEAKGDIRVFTDADLAYGTEVIKRAYDMMCENGGTDMLIGSRNMGNDGYEGYTLLRKIMSKTYIKVLCITGGFKLSDSQCGCKAYKREAVGKIFPRCQVNGFAFDFETILWAVKYQMKIIELPVKVINSGESKVSIVKDTVKMLSDLIKMKKRIKKAKL